MLSARVAAAVKQVQTAKQVDFGNLEAVLHNFVFMHQVITASERLLVEAAQEARGELKDYYLRHLEEERRHEEWLSDDLRQYGVDTAVIPLMHQAAELAGSQYYQIKHVHPATLLGYMAVLEGSPMPLEFVDRAEQLHGKVLFRTLRFHAEHDIDHGAEVLRMIDQIGHPAIMGNAIRTAICLNEFSRSLGEALERAPAVTNFKKELEACHAL